MCGIAGSIGGSEKQVAAMLDRIEHRGPDGRGLQKSGKTVHGHVRLALVDLTEGSAQPFVRAGHTLSFNGEIWNYKELKEESPNGFITSGDTEVLADQLCQLGLVCLPFLDGMFAFAWSSPDGEHWLVRDSFGKIPLYVAKTKTGYLWASERKAFPKGIKPIAVPPGHAFNLVTGEWLKWYHPQEYKPTSGSDVLKLLRAGVNKRLAADAPVCCLISGGLDSSIILALAQERSKNVTAFTGRFDPQAEDLKSARRLCSDLGIKLIEVPVEVTPTLWNEAIRSIEIASKAQIEIAMLCLPLARRIYAEGFRACLSGEAADELFGGYGNFCIKASKLKGREIIPLRKEQLKKMSRGNFVRCNKAFMSAGVECRLPFMEQELVERVILLDKEESPTGKVLLKKAAKPILPSWVIKRQKDTFQGGSGLASAMAERISNPLVFYNSELRKEFGYLPKD